jgi:hypothetical protein
MGIQIHPKAVSQGNVCPASYAFIRATPAEIHIVVPRRWRRATATNIFVENAFIV